MSFDPFLIGIIVAINACLFVLFIYASYRFRKHLKNFNLFFENYHKDMSYFNENMDYRFKAAYVRSQTDRDLANGRLMEVRRNLENKIQDLEKSIEPIKQSSDKLYS